MKSFPIPVVALGPGSQPEDEALQYTVMPQGMDTYRPPSLPEPEDVVDRLGARRALQAALESLGHATRGEAGPTVDLQALEAADLQLVNQVLGEGEVSAVVKDEARPGSLEWHVQESVFAGVWRVIATERGSVVSDTIEIGSLPHVLRIAARDDVRAALAPWQGALPANVQNAPAVLAEILDHSREWRPGLPPRVVNLTLLPMSPEDIGFLDHHLGTGRVLILSRGYGNCRITDTRTPHCWRVVYYNSQDAVILNTVEVTEVPEVALAAAEDLAESHERLAEVLAWMAS